MAKIVFYEGRNFEGRRHECTSDCTDFRAALERCRSVRVESGMFVIYDRPGYAGNQFFVKKGDYPDHRSMSTMNDCVRSCRVVPMHSGTFRMRLYEHFDMRGETMELTDDCPNLTERFRTSGCNSCNVVDGHWLLYEQPHYRGRHYYLRPGAYRSFSDWSGNNSRIGSVRRLTDL